MRSFLKNLLTISCLGTTGVAFAQTNINPAATPGSTGSVSFPYNGQTVTYTTVRAADGNIWLQQNLGSTQVATTATDASAYGDLFQWGRWDDGHQLRTPTPVLRPVDSLVINNPLGINGGTDTFYYYVGNYVYWWAAGAATDTWSGTTVTATNGKDPCTALGTGWHLPSAAEWTTVQTAENITNVATGFNSYLKLPAAGYRGGTNSTGSISLAGTAGSYATSTAADYFFSIPIPLASYFRLTTATSTTNATQTINRNTAMSCRCMKLNSVALPVKMSSLSGSMEGNHASLSWNTYTEQDNRGFTIQRSEDGKRWSNIGFVASQGEDGNSQILLNYSYNDEPLEAAALYYRIRQQDISGYAFSNTVTLNIDKLLNDPELAIYPNPNDGICEVVISGALTNEGTITISDFTGKTIILTRVVNERTLLDLTALPAGTYILKYADQNNKVTTKLIRQ